MAIPRCRCGARLFDDELGLVATAEGFQAQALVSELAVEALADAILPGASRLEVVGLAALARSQSFRLCPMKSPLLSLHMKLASHRHGSGAPAYPGPGHATLWRLKIHL